MIQKSILSGLGSLALLAGTASADLLITEIVDGTLVGGLPKWVELTNTGSTTLDLSGFSIGNYNNGGNSLGGGISLVLSGMLAPGASYVVSYEANDGPGVGTFFTVYGTDPSNFDLGAFINGNDVIALFLADGTGPNGEATGDGSDATMIDVYGTIGVDGTLATWDYTDSYAFRCGSSATPVFDDTDWFIAGPDALEAGCGGDDTCETTNLQTLTTPFVHTGCATDPGTPVCFGDGAANGGIDCPCANDADAGSESGCRNSCTPGAGAGAIMTASGSNSLTETLTLDCDRVRSIGLFFQAVNTIAGGDGALFGDGIRCCGGTVRRVSIESAPGACPGGAVSTDIDATSLTPGGTGAPIWDGITPGDKRCYQYWYRDPGGPCGLDFNLSNAVTVTFTP